MGKILIFLSILELTLSVDNSTLTLHFPCLNCLHIHHPIFYFRRQSFHTLGSSINDVTALGGGGGQGSCDNSTKALVIKCMTMGGGGVKNC